MNEHKHLKSLINVVKELRDPQTGCPWDIKQTHHSLLKYLIEESYEYIHAVESNDYPHMEEELGDVLLQILLHTTIAEENQKFSLESVSKRLREKLIRRHPHVFENTGTKIDVSDVVSNWEKIKQEEKLLEEEKSNLASFSHIDPSYLAFPALFSSYKIGKKTADIKFDWENYHQVLEKVEEELNEFKIEIDKKSEKTEEEFGDLLFSMAQLGRHIGINPEDSLRKANKKFLKRFHQMENKIKNAGKSIVNMNQEQMDIYWNKVKNDENKNS